MALEQIMRSHTRRLLLVVVVTAMATAVQSAIAGLIIEFGKNVPLCKEISQRNEWNPRLGDDAKILPPRGAKTDFIADKKTGYAPGDLTGNSFDLDNDGHIETVYGYHPFSHGQKADIYFVTPSSDFDNKWPRITSAELWRSSPYIFPYAHGQCNQQHCGENDKGGKITIKNFKIEGLLPLAYRFRYLHTTPFIWRGTTYFLLQSEDYGLKNITAVVKPEKNRTLVEICVFRTNSPK